ncbi:hypothetical protein D0859_02395 [Hortaea werneckii]|uniref:Uncharacterized protein n=1 Tax=Hortaea werneckii TaxID=91943 RepID=A0A3M7J743_HORWE|nr:hypothetical protein D0859_02395 [Hortaea werneckii]
MVHREADSDARQSCEVLGQYDPGQPSFFEVSRSERPHGTRRRGRGLITYGKSSRSLSSKANQSLIREMRDAPSKREPERSDNSPRRVSALLRAAERDSSDSLLSDSDIASLDSLPTTGEVQIPTSSSLSVAEPIEELKGKRRVLCPSSSNALIQRKPAPTHLRLTSFADSSHQHSHLQNRRRNHCPTINGATGKGRQAQTDDDSLLRPRPDSEDLQPQAPLTTIRKRIRSSKLEHKIVKYEGSRRPFPLKGNRNIGDGFEKSELHFDNRIVSHRKRKPWRRGPIIYKQLPIAGGPLPDVMFECSADELNVEQSGGPHHITAHLPSSSRPADPTDQLAAADEQAQNSLKEETRANFDYGDCAGRGLRTSGPTEKTTVGSNHHSKRRVSFSDRDRFISAQLSSIKAPPRPQATSDDDDAEDPEEEDDDDDEDESGSSEDEEQGALQNVDAAKGIDDELLVDYADHSFISQRSAAFTTLYSTSSYITGEDAVDSSNDESPEGRIETPRFFRRRSVERMRLMEADEPVEEFPDRGPHAERTSAAVSSHYPGSTVGHSSRKTLIQSDILEEDADCIAGQARRPRLRSILKSNMPLMPEVT